MSESSRRSCRSSTARCSWPRASRGLRPKPELDLELVKEPSWASLRDHLSLGHVDCAHALAPLPVALTLGVGHVQVDCIAPFVLGRGGNAVTVSTQLFDEMYASSPAESLEDPAAAGRALAAVVRARAMPLTLGMVFPFSNHNFDLRYWLAAAGVHPDRDVRLVAIPPPLMVESLQAGLVDGFCVGEPWNSLAVDARSRSNRRDAVAAVSAGRREGTRAARIVRGARQPFSRGCCKRSTPRPSGSTTFRITPRSRHCSRGPNISACRRRVSRRRSTVACISVWAPPSATWISCTFTVTPRTRRVRADGLWVYAQMVRWGQLAPSAQAQSAAAEVFRPDLYRQCLPAAAFAAPAPQPFDRIEFSRAMSVPI